MLAAHCYGGMASTAFLRAALELEAACVARGVRLRTELGGGEALVNRARAGQLAQFLRGEASHLVLCDGDKPFEAEALLGLVDAGHPVAIAPGLLVVRRDAARRVVEGYPALQASLRDIRGASEAPAAMVFDGLIEAGRYLSDLEAFGRRWRDLGGAVYEASVPCP